MILYGLISKISESKNIHYLSIVLLYYFHTIVENGFLVAFQKSKDDKFKDILKMGG